MLESTHQPSVTAGETTPQADGVSIGWINHAEVQHAFDRLRADLDGVFQKHQHKLQRKVVYDYGLCEGSADKDRGRCRTNSPQPRPRGQGAEGPAAELAAARGPAPSAVSAESLVAAPAKPKETRELRAAAQVPSSGVVPPGGIDELEAARLASPAGCRSPARPSVASLFVWRGIQSSGCRSTDSLEIVEPASAARRLLRSGSRLASKVTVSPAFGRSQSAGSIEDDRQSKTLQSCMQAVTSAASLQGPQKNSSQAKISKAAPFSPLSRRKLEVLESRKSCVQRITRSHAYELVNAAFIVLNALFVVCETERRATLARSSGTQLEIPARDWGFAAAANFFCVVLVADLALRMWSEQRQFFLSRGRAWNVFDMFVVLTVLCEALTSWVDTDSSRASGARIFLRKFAMLRILRLLRVIRSTHAIKVIWFIRELRLMVYSLTGTAKSLGWSLVLLLIILLVFGVFFTDGAITYCVLSENMASQSTAELRRYFGSMPDAVVSLYMAMSGGEDWGNIMVSLDPLPPEYRFFFLVFITFAVLALLNVVTAIFVETAMQMSQNDKELVVMEELKSKDEFVAVMQQVFEELDTNDSGALSLEEFEKHIEDEKIVAFLSSMGLDVSQVRTLFTLLDVDRTGEVDLEEFVSGCLRLRGGAKSLDMAILKFQVDWILHNFRSMDTYVRECLGLMLIDSTSGGNSPTRNRVPCLRRQDSCIR